ncbi:Tetratricopeptide repeat protein 31 [Halotydeus destructor]|nr:Tetratricopeptide repeat protein 31 [Halotydeus destructor]
MDQAAVIAAQGVASAQDGNYVEAIQLFTSAIELNPLDFRFHINRSYCYHSAKLFELSLEDAEKAISLNTDAVKGHYRKALALIGLNRYNDAEIAFNEVLRRDPECDSSQNKRKEIRYIMLRQQGLDEVKARKIAEGFYPVELYCNSTSVSEEKDDQTLYEPKIKVMRKLNSFDGGDSLVAKAGPEVLDQVRLNAAELLEGDNLKRATNVLGFYGLKVSNLSKKCNKEKVISLFEKYGKIVQLSQVKNENVAWACVVIHYDNAESPIDALTALRDEIQDELTCHESLRPLVMWLTPSSSQRKEPSFLPLTEAIEKCNKAKECFGWRGPIGCGTGRDCELGHFRINRAIDCHKYIN